MASIRNYDIDNEDNAFDFSNVKIQHKFARKVFTLLFFQLISTFYIIRMFLYIKPLISHLKQHQNLFWLALFLLCIVYISISCCETCRRTYPIDMVAFLLFSIVLMFFFCMSVVISEFTEIETSLAFLSITYFIIILYLYQTDFPFMGFSTYLVVIMTTFTTYCALVVIDPNFVTIKLLRGGIWSLIATIYSVFDLQLMMRGTNFTRLYSENDYFFGALNIYADVMKFVGDMLLVIFKP